MNTSEVYKSLANTYQARIESLSFVLDILSMSKDKKEVINELIGFYQERYEYWNDQVTINVEINQ